MRPRKPYQNFDIICSSQKDNFQHKTIFGKFGFRKVIETAEADSGSLKKTAEAASVVSMRPP
jgi:hypothetical protein